MHQGLSRRESRRTKRRPAPTASARLGRGRYDWFLVEHVPAKIRSGLGLDVKGSDDYLVVCPTRHFNDHNIAGSGKLHHAVPLPRAARRLLKADTHKKRIDGECGILAQGGRNDGLTRIAGSLARRRCPASFGVGRSIWMLQRPLLVTNASTSR